MESYYSDVCPDCKISWDDGDHWACDFFNSSSDFFIGLAAIAKTMTSLEWTLEHKRYPRCGTKYGHDDHRRKYKDEPCEACMDGMRRYWREHKAKPEIKEKNRIYNRTNRKLRNGTRFKKLLAQGFNPAKDYFSANMVIETYGTNCHLCGGEVDLLAPRTPGKPGWEKSLHVDHVVPLSRGGDDTLENVRPSHGKCNVKKHNRIVENIATE